MSRTRQAPQARPGRPRISEDHDLVGPDAKDDIEAADDRERHWYHLRPKPRRGTDFMGFNSRWWMALGWLALLIVVAFPFPGWW